MKNLVRAAVCSALLGLVGCGTGVDAGGNNGPRLPGATGGDATSTGAVQAADVNERGFIVKQLGEQACFGGAGTNCEGGVSFAIDKVEVDPPCALVSPSDGAHALLLHVRIATGSDAETADRVGGVINPFSFVEIGKDGVTREAEYGMCADTSAGLPDTFGPNQQYTGVIDIEVPQASGTVALQLSMADENGERGWEWTYPV